MQSLYLFATLLPPFSLFIVCSLCIPFQLSWYHSPYLSYAVYICISLQLSWYHSPSLSYAVSVSLSNSLDIILPLYLMQSLYLFTSLLLPFSSSSSLDCGISAYLRISIATLLFLSVSCSLFILLNLCCYPYLPEKYLVSQFLSQVQARARQSNLSTCQYLFSALYRSRAICFYSFLHFLRFLHLMFNFCNFLLILNRFFQRTPDWPYFYQVFSVL